MNRLDWERRPADVKTGLQPLQLPLERRRFLHLGMAGLSVGATDSSVPAMVLATATIFLLLRSRTGLGLTALRDNATAASSSGVRTQRAKRLVFVLGAAGCGVCGALFLVNSLRVQPDSAFSIWGLLHDCTGFSFFLTRHRVTVTAGSPQATVAVKESTGALSRGSRRPAG